MKLWNPFSAFSALSRRKKHTETASVLEQLRAGILRSVEPSPRAHEHFNSGNFDVSNNLLITEAERSRLRSWCKKEYLDNPHARHIARAFTLAVYGTGPTLQITTDDESLNTEIERLFADWSEAAELNWKWHVALNSLFFDGESFFHFIHDPDVPGGWGVELLEANRISEPFSAGMSPHRLEGIEYNEWNKPILYWVEKETVNPYVGQPREHVGVPAERILHFFLDDVTNQKRGLPLLQASLQTLASLQRISQASLNAWELCAALNVIFESSVETADLLPCLPKGLSKEAALNGEKTLPALETIRVPKDGGGFFLPTGVKANQMHSEHPTSQFAENKTTYLTEAGLCAEEPRNISTGDSSPYNYSSAQMDNEMFSRWAGTVQGRIRKYLNRMLLVACASQVHENPAAAVFLDKARGRTPATWYFPRMLESIDRMKDAQAEVALLNAGLDTIRAWCQRHGIDYQQHMEQLKQEREQLQEQKPQQEQEPTKGDAPDGFDV